MKTIPKDGISRLKLLYAINRARVSGNGQAVAELYSLYEKAMSAEECIPEKIAIPRNCKALFRNAMGTTRRSRGRPEGRH